MRLVSRTSARSLLIVQVGLPTSVARVGAVTLLGALIAGLAIGTPVLILCWVLFFVLWGRRGAQNGVQVATARTPEWGLALGTQLIVGTIDVIGLVNVLPVGGNMVLMLLHFQPKVRLQATLEWSKHFVAGGVWV